MEQKLGKKPVMALTAVLSAAAYFLRRRQLSAAFDETGRVLLGAGNCFFTYFTIFAALAFGVYAFFLTPRKRYDSIRCERLSLCLLSCLGALGLAVGSAAMFLKPQLGSDSYIAVGGFVAALCWIASAVFQRRGRTPHWLLATLPVLYFMAKLIPDFRVWSRDPAILDYCYDLLALLSILCAVLHAGRFVFDSGRRRSAVFFCLCSEFFGAASLAGASKRHLALTLGAMVWIGVQLWSLLSAAEREEPEEAPEPEA